MAKVVFTPNLKRHVACPDADAAGRTVREVLDGVFASHPQVRGYVLDDQAHLRANVVVFIDGVRCSERVHLADAVGEHTRIHVMQALSGG